MSAWVRPSSPFRILAGKTVPGSSYSRFREDESNEDILDSNPGAGAGIPGDRGRGGDDWNAPPPRTPSGALGQPLAAGVSLGLPVAVLGDPVPLDPNPAGGRTVVIDPHLERTGYSPGGDPDSPWVVRGQNPDSATPKPMPLAPILRIQRIASIACNRRCSRTLFPLLRLRSNCRPHGPRSVTSPTPGPAARYPLCQCRWPRALEPYRCQFQCRFQAPRPLPARCRA